MILLTERQQRRNTRESYRRYSFKYVIWGGQYYVGGSDTVHDLGVDIFMANVEGYLTDIRVKARDLESAIQNSRNGVVLLGFGKGLNGEPVIFTVIENRFTF